MLDHPAIVADLQNPQQPKSASGVIVAALAHNMTFPSTMVDRIVPVMTAETLDKIEPLISVRDPAGVACEPFLQWVIEDNFVAGRPEWEETGAELVADVLPFEDMKLRMLNSSHSFLAYLGYLSGYQHINECMEDELFRRAARVLMLEEQAPTLNVTGVDSPAMPIC